MALRRVDLSTDVYFVCLNHAMCTEGEEIVGLLVGEVDEERVAHVVAVLILRRSDKRKDRVEISPEQLSNASTEAEKLACILKKPVRVVGWYHSHPKLTVYPSLVDVCTQESYQLMDEGFIGMIFSVFNPDPNKFGGRIQMICFQSQTVIIDCNVEKSHLEIPIQLVPSSNISDVCMNSVIQLPRFLCQEEQLAYQMANQVPLDYLTRLHNSSVYLRKMGQISEVICGPLLKMLEERILNNEMKRKRLQERKKALTAMVEKARAEKIKKEKERQEKAAQKELERQEKSDIDQQSLLKEQELRALLIKKQKIREKSQLTMQDQELSHVEDQEMQIDSQIGEQAAQGSSQNKTQNESDVTLIRDQEVPEFNEQGECVVEEQEMKELEIEEVDWQAELQQQVLQNVVDFQKQEVIPEGEIEKNVIIEMEVSQDDAGIEGHVFKDETSDESKNLEEIAQLIYGVKPKEKILQVKHQTDRETNSKVNKKPEGEIEKNVIIEMEVSQNDAGIEEQVFKDETSDESKKLQEIVQLIYGVKPKEKILQVKHQTDRETNLQSKMQDISESELSGDILKTHKNSSIATQDVFVNISTESNSSVEPELIVQSDKLDIDNVNAAKITITGQQNIALSISTGKDKVQSNISNVLIQSKIEKGAIASSKSDKMDVNDTLDAVVDKDVKEQKSVVQSSLTKNDKVGINVLGDSIKKDLERQQNVPCASPVSVKPDGTVLEQTIKSDFNIQKNVLSSDNNQLCDNVLNVDIQTNLEVGQQAAIQNISSACDKLNTGASDVHVKK